jgi:hypothetical protein
LLRKQGQKIYISLFIYLLAVVDNENSAAVAMATVLCTGGRFAA